MQFIIHYIENQVSKNSIEPTCELSEISGSRGADYEDCSLLGCDTV
jgi:hypothetical protein